MVPFATVQVHVGLAQLAVLFCTAVTQSWLADCETFVGSPELDVQTVSESANEAPPGHTAVQVPAQITFAGPHPPADRASAAAKNLRMATLRFSTSPSLGHAAAQQVRELLASAD